MPFRKPPVFVACFCFALFTSCNFYAGIRSPIAAAQSAPLVFVPGLMGSTLYDNDGDQVWLTPGQGLGLSTPDLSLPLAWEDDKQRGSPLVSKGSLQSVKILFGLIGTDVYAPWEQAAAEIPGRELYVFGYDWRRDNNENAAALEAFLTGLRTRYGETKIGIVGHSMGGMLTLAVLNKHPDWFDRVVFAGVPFRGGIGHLDNLRDGTPIGSNAELLTPPVLFSHPSVFSFYPSGQAWENRDATLGADGKVALINFYSEEVWERYRFGPYAPENAGWFSGSPEQRAHFTMLLERGRLFRRSMTPQRGAQYPPALVLMSKDHPTIARIVLRERDDTNAATWQHDPKREPGDSTVLYTDALPPEPIPYEVHLTQNEHSYLLNDPTAQRRIADFLSK